MNISTLINSASPDQLRLALQSLLLGMAEEGFGTNDDINAGDAVDSLSNLFLDVTQRVLAQPHTPASNPPVPSPSHTEPPQSLDPSLAGVAICALKNGFYAQFLELVGAYVSAAKGLNEDDLLDELSSSCNVYSYTSPNRAAANPLVPIEIRDHSGGRSPAASIVQALSHPNAVQVLLRNTAVFERGATTDWMFVDIFSTPN